MNPSTNDNRHHSQKEKKATIAENRIIKLALITDLGKNWARCLPNWGKVLTHPGHAAYPGWAELQSGICPIS